MRAAFTWFFRKIIGLVNCSKCIGIDRLNFAVNALGKPCILLRAPKAYAMKAGFIACHLINFGW